MGTALLIIGIVAAPFAAIFLIECRTWTKEGRRRELQERINTLGRGF